MAYEFFNDIGELVGGQFERDEKADTRSQVAVAVVTSPYVPIDRALRSRGFTNVVPFYDLARSLSVTDHPLQNGWVASPLTDEDCAQIFAVYRGLDDDRSRAHYLSFLAWRMSREEWFFDDAPVVVENRYFVPEVVGLLGGDEYFFDGGAYDGRVTRKFAALTGGRFRGATLVEPDSENRKLINYQTGPDVPPVRVEGWALAGTSSEMRFFDGFGFMSRIGRAGRCWVLSRRVDDLDVAPTFVKLHLEGGELSALRGAERTLKKFRPIVAVTTYHSDDGIWKIPGWLMSALENYKFLWRNHGWCGTGAVVYAIPKEREA